MNPTKYWRLRPDAVTIESADTTALSEPSELIHQLRPGHAVLLADYDSIEQVGIVSWLGVVREVAGVRPTAVVDWRASDLVLKPEPAGRRWWTQEASFFAFAKTVVDRYMLDDIFADVFTEFADPETGSKSSVKRPGPSGRPVAGFVYVIKSEHRYKIGKTVDLRSRTRLFEVKLPFPISIEHYAWFDDYTAAELRFHRMFKEKRLEGEWFDLSSDDLAKIKGYGEAVPVRGL